ncbi:MAG: hypothetical protein R3E39_25395 [Anaerolineae bacterium]
MIQNQPDSSPPEWAQQLQARGLGHAVSVALDVLEPLGPLGAQLLWVAQPVLGVFMQRDTLTSVAESLEASDKLDALRRFFDGE